MKGNRVDLWLGPMTSGKTDEMLRTLRRHTHLSRTIVRLLKYAADPIAGNTTVLSRSNASMSAHDAINTGEEGWDFIRGCLAEAGESGANNIVIGLDEAQFVTDLDVMVKAVLGYEGSINIRLVMAGLDSDFRGIMWENIIRVIPYCNSVVKLEAICDTCQETDAQLTKRLVANNERILLDKDHYSAACYKCHLASIAK